MIYIEEGMVTGRTQIARVKDGELDTKRVITANQLDAVMSNDRTWRALKHLISEASE